jgi:hypothetical protein
MIAGQFSALDQPLAYIVRSSPRQYFDRGIYCPVGESEAQIACNAQAKVGRPEIAECVLGFSVECLLCLSRRNEFFVAFPLEPMLFLFEVFPYPL